MSENTLNLEHLLKDTGWLRALARSLIADAAQADDLVQQTLLEAVKRPPAHPEAAGSWLAKVLRNFARRSHRSRARRLAREKKAARPECAVQESPEALLERMELQKLVLNKVSELNEPYRSTVLLRFFKDLSIRKIAQAQNIPADTVKTRLRRALEKIRGQFDKHYNGDRQAWCLSLLPLAGFDFAASLSAASAGAGAAAGAATGAGAGGAAALSSSLSFLTLGGVIMTYKAALTVAGLGLISLALGWGLGRYTAPIDREAAMTEHQLVSRLEYEDLQKKHGELAESLKAARQEGDRMAREREQLAKQLADIKKAEQAALAAQNTTAPKPPKTLIPFGKYASLDAVKSTDWHDMGAAVSSIHQYIAEMIQLMEKGEQPSADLQVKIQRENKRLEQMAISLIGKIPTHKTGNGEYTHPLILSNLMTAMLDNAELSLTDKQHKEITAIGAEFDKEYEFLQENYDENTLNLEKFMDELSLKHNIIEAMIEQLSPEQRKTVAPDDFHGYQSIDCLSPALMTVLMFNAHNKDNGQAFLDEAPKYFGDKYELNDIQRDEAKNLFQTWAENIAPNLNEPVEDSKIPLHINHIITAGNAKIALLKGLLQIQDLSETTLNAIQGDMSLSVPRLLENKAKENKTDE